MSSVFAFGQGYRMNITVLNAESLEPVPYATIMYVEQQSGFSTNAAGKFSIRFHKVEFERQISISSIGYEQLTLTLGQLVQDSVEQILLKPKVTILEELLVKAEAETPLNIVKNTSKKLANFLGDIPYYQHVFYKEHLRQNGIHVGFTEGYGIMYVTNYEQAARKNDQIYQLDLVQWKNIRRSYYELKNDCDTLQPRILAINKLLKAK